MKLRGTLGASVAIGIAIAIAAAMTVTPVLAHSRYKSSTPSTGEVLASSPSQVAITFTEQIQKVSGSYEIQVTRDRGAAVTAGATTVDDADRTQMSVPIQPSLGPGRYVVSWKNTSDDDGDAANGAFSFYVGTQPNTVDLANDAQLAQVGFEEVTATAAAENGTPGNGAATSTSASPGTTAPEATGSPGISPATPAATSTSANGSSGSNTTIYVIVAIAVVAAVAGVGGWWFVSRRGA